MYSLNATSEMPVLFISVICIDKRVKHKKLLVPFVDGLVRPVLAKVSGGDRPGQCERMEGGIVNVTGSGGKGKVRVNRRDF